MGFQSKIFVDHHCVLTDFDITLDCEECIFQTIEYRTDKSIREKHIQSRISIISHHQCSLQT